MKIVACFDSGLTAGGSRSRVGSTRDVLLDFALDFLSEGDESSLDVVAAERRGLHELDAEGISEFLAFGEGNLTFAFEIVLVADEEFHDVAVCVLVGFLQPVIDIFECLAVSDVVYEDYSVSTLVV